MTPDSPRHQSSGFGTFVWALFFFLVFAVLIVGVTRWSAQNRSLNDPRAEGRLKIREEQDKDDREKLTTPGWVDQANGIVRLPIAQAKKIVIADLKAKKPAPSSVPIDPVLPMPVLDPNAAEPPPPPLPSAPQGSDTLSLAALTARPPESAPAAPAVSPVPAGTLPTTPATPTAPPAAAPPLPAAPAPGAPAGPAPVPAKPGVPSATPAAPTTSTPAAVPGSPAAPAPSPAPANPSPSANPTKPAQPSSPNATENSRPK